MIAKSKGSNDTDTDKCRNRQLYTDLSVWIAHAENCLCFERTGHHGQYEEYNGSFSSLWRNLSSQLPGYSTNAQSTSMTSIGNVCHLSYILLLK